MTTLKSTGLGEYADCWTGRKNDGKNAANWWRRESERTDKDTEKENILKRRKMRNQAD